MKRFFALMFALVLCLVSVSAAMAESDVEKALADAAGMSWDELLVKAKEEIGDGTLKAYGNASAEFCDNFSALTGIKTEYTLLNDVPLYVRLDAELGSGTYGADVVLIQDSYSLQTTMLEPGYLLNYMPEYLKGDIAPEDQNPTAVMYLNKLFIYNNTDGRTGYLKNVWQLAGTEEDPGHISGCSFKPSSTEQVNMNFLVMLTTGEWCQKLEAAYESYYGKAWENDGAYKNIGYKWIAEFLRNSASHSSDGSVIKSVASSTVAGTMCLANYCKFKSLSVEDQGVGTESRANVQVAAYEGVEGFAGFLFQMYAQVCCNAKYPYTSALLVDYMLSTDCFNQAWGGKPGYYSANVNAAYAAEANDQPLSYWKDCCVIENPELIAQNYTSVFKFISSLESAQ